MEAENRFTFGTHDAHVTKDVGLQLATKALDMMFKKRSFTPVTFESCFPHHYVEVDSDLITDSIFLFVTLIQIHVFIKFIFVLFVLYRCSSPCSEQMTFDELLTCR